MKKSILIFLLLASLAAAGTETTDPTTETDAGAGNNKTSIANNSTLITTTVVPKQTSSTASSSSTEQEKTTMSISSMSTEKQKVEETEEDNFENSTSTVNTTNVNVIIHYKKMVNFISLQLSDNIKLKIYSFFLNVFNANEDSFVFKTLVTVTFVIFDLLWVFTIVFAMTSILSRVRKLSKIAFGPLKTNVRRNIEALL